MVNPVELYQFAEQNNIDVDWFSMPINKSLSLKLPDSSCCIAMDPWKLSTLADESVCLAHELGHCMTGSFYNPYAAYDLIEKHEYRANKWAIKKLIPEDELNLEVANGNTDVWSLAEHFGVTEDFMEEAIHFYIAGHIPSDHTRR